jgi:hypothetical protein
MGESSNAHLAVWVVLGLMGVLIGLFLVAFGWLSEGPQGALSYPVVLLMGVAFLMWAVYERYVKQPE